MKLRLKLPKIFKRRKRGGNSRLFSKTIRFGLLAAIWGSIVGVLVLGYCIHDLPSTEKLTKAASSHQIRILSSDGQLITNLGEVSSDDLSYEDIPEHLINAVIATEDRRFFKHFGFDIYGFTRAMFENLKAGQVVQGGSTITQQLAKVVFLSPERTIKRKIQELILAIWIEQRFTKKEIMTMYLNRVYMGSGFFGVDAAARGYFGKPARYLTLNESAMLAGLLKAPTRYSPFTDKKLAKKRATQVIANMVDAGMLSKKKASQSGTAIQTKQKQANSRYYFTDWLSGQIPDYVGIIDSDLVITTTLDLRLQSYAEEAIKKVLSEQGDDRNVKQAALVAMTPQGEILAMVGGRDYGQSQFNRAAQAQRQPGSSFKFFPYLAALEAGYLPHDEFIDEEIEIDGWRPKNYDEEYRGEISMKTAFALSINSVAVKIAEMVGRNRVIEVARRLGIESPLLPIASLALGTNEVNLMEMTQAYAHLPNDGYPVRMYGIKEIKTAAGETLYKRAPSSPGGRVIDKNIVARMNALLKEVMEEGTGRKARLLRETAGKTGTSQDFRDAWFVGFTPQVVAGVWIGNDDDTPMDGVTGGTLAGQIWMHFMKDTHQTIEPRSIPTDTGLFNWFRRNWSGNRHSDRNRNNEEAERQDFWNNVMEDVESEDQDTSAESSTENNSGTETDTQEWISPDSEEPQKPQIEIHL